MAFLRGQKIVCIKVGEWTDQGQLEQWPVYGEIYTVRGYDPYYNCGPDAGIWLEEVINSERHAREGFSEPSFWVARFRPLVKRKTDISVFEKMLNPDKQFETAD
jgi:hypothetical protein